MKVRAFIIQHMAESISECEDRFAINCDDRIVAVSDGVSQSIFQAEWAEMLVTHYIKKGNYTNEDRVSTLCPMWYKHVQEYLQNHDDWMLESMIAEGKSAGATLCGVKFINKNHWQCDVLGDSCLVVVENNRIKEILSSEVKAFDNYPDYIDSNPRHTGRGEIKNYEGDIEPNNCLLLVSDPFSDFFTQLGDKSDLYITQLLSINSHEEYKLLVEKWRLEGMHNDDSTVVIIEWDGKDNFTTGHVDCLKNLVDEETSTSIKDSSKNDDYTKIDEDLSSTLHKDEKSPTKSGTTKCDVNSDAQIKDDIDVNVIQKKKDINVNEIKNLVPEFVTSYMQNINASSKTGFASLLSYAFHPKKHRVKALEKLLQDVVFNFIDYYFNKNR